MCAMLCKTNSSLLKKKRIKIKIKRAKNISKRPTYVWDVKYVFHYQWALAAAVVVVMLFLLYVILNRMWYNGSTGFFLSFLFLTRVYTKRIQFSLTSFERWNCLALSRKPQRWWIYNDFMWIHCFKPRFQILNVSRGSGTLFIRGGLFISFFFIFIMNDLFIFYTSTMLNRQNQTTAMKGE